MSEDLGPESVGAVLGTRPVRSYPAMLSTESGATAWARAGAAPGSLVVSDYQASPRGRGGLPWTVRPGRDLGFSLVLRPDLPAEREGWPYVAALLAVAEVLQDAVVEWPDSVLCGATALASLGVYAEPAATGIAWLTLTVLVTDVRPPRAPLLGQLVDAVEGRLLDDPEAVLGDFRRRCVTLGRQVRARMIPMGPGGPEILGQAVDVLADGSLVVLTPRGSRVAVPPQNLGLLEAPEDPAEVPPDVRSRLER